MEVKVSIIMPTLNQKKYIKKCMESVCRQSLKEIEIICIDAGSSDGTAEIVEHIATLDNRIKLIKSDKKSYGYQVNLGIRHAKGKYIGIVETDDEVNSNMYEILYLKAVSINADFVKANFYGIYNEENEEKEKEYAIINNNQIYNRIITCNTQKDVFLHNITATWSGIYNKNYLLENNILHNETYGASFQDTGFWFQTYMYAKTAMFIDVPLYRYRIDNEASSTFDSSKVYCICDEFKFILNRIIDDNKLLNFKDVFCWIFFKKYFRNLERIKEIDRVAFLKRFSDDFNWLRHNCMLDMSLFSMKENNILEQICDTGSDYLRIYYEGRKKFLYEIIKNKNLIIYGAGKVGNRLKKEIEQLDIDNNININFAVTKRDNNMVGISEISDLLEIKDCAKVIIAVLDSNVANEMEKNAKELGFKNIIRLEFGMWEF